MAGPRLPPGFSLTNPAGVAEEKPRRPRLPPGFSLSEPELPPGFDMETPVPPRGAMRQNVGLGFHDLPTGPLNNNALNVFMKERGSRIQSATAEKEGDRAEWVPSRGLLGGVADLTASLSESLFGGKRTTQTVENRPEFTPAALRTRYTMPDTMSSDQALDVAKMAAVESADSTEEQIKMIKNWDQDAQFKLDEKGNIVVISGTGTETILNKPGMSGMDARNLFNQALAFLPAGKIASLGKGVLSKMGLGAVASGVTSEAIQRGQESLGGEYNIGQVGLDVALGGLAEGVGPGIQSIINRRRRAKIDATFGSDVERAQQSAARVTEAKDVIKDATGVDISVFKGQLTGLKTTLDDMPLMASLPPGADIALKGINKQNKDVALAVRRLIGGIASQDALKTGAGKIRDIAKMAVKDTKAARAAATKPYYDLAWRTDEGVDVTQALNYVENTLKKVDPEGPSAALLKKAQKTLKGERLENGLVRKDKKTLEGEQVDYAPSLQVLDSMKKRIDRVLEKSKLEPDAIDEEAKAIMTELKDKMMVEMKQNEAYDTALKIHQQESPAVEELTQGIIGQISKTKNKDLKNVSNMVFDLNQTNPKILKDTKNLIKRYDPKAWNEIVRVELHKRTNNVRDQLRAAGDDISEEAHNVPLAMLKAVFGGRGKQQMNEVLMSALDPKQRKIARKMKEILEITAKGRVTGSPTAARTERLSKLKSNVEVFANFLSSPVSSLGKFGAQKGFEKQARALTKAIYDPDFTMDGLKLAQMDLKNPKTWAFLNSYVSRMMADETEEK